MFAVRAGKPGVVTVACVVDNDWTRELLSLTTSTTWASDAEGGSARGIGCVYCCSMRGQPAPLAEHHSSPMASQCHADRQTSRRSSLSGDPACAPGVRDGPAWVMASLP